MYSKTLQSSASLNSKVSSMLTQNRSPRSNSRKGNNVTSISGSLSQSAGKTLPTTTGFSGQIYSQSLQLSQSQSVQLGETTTLASHYNSASSHQGSAMMNNYASSHIGSTMTTGSYINGSVNSVQGNQNQYKLLCRKHDKPIEKICTKIGCEQLPVLCSDCYFDSQQHIGLHKEHMFNYDDFINVCKSFSLKNKGDQTGGKQLSSLLAKLDKQVHKYRAHTKKEEEKINADFDALISQFTRDVEEVKSKLKAPLQAALEKYQEMSRSLKIKAQDLQQEREQNLDSENDFDEFLKNIKDVTTTRQQGAQNYNFKKLVSNIAPLVSRFKDQITKLVNNPTTAQSVVINTEQSETLSCFTGVTGLSSLTLNFSSQPHLAPIKDLYNDLKELSHHKPMYKNKGEGMKMYDDSQADLKRIYHDFIDNVNFFVHVPKPKLALDFNKETIDALTISEKPEIDDLQFIQKSDYFALAENQTVTKIDLIKTVNTVHKAGILSLVIVDDDTYVTGSADRTVKVFSMRDHRLIKEIRFSSDITALSTLRRMDGSVLVLVGLYGGFTVLSQGFEIMKVLEGEHEANVNCMVGLKDCETVITASSDPKIVAWNLFNSDIHNKKYFDHKDTVYALELFPCGKFMASGGRDRSIKLWRLQYYKDNFRNGALEKMVLDTNFSDAHSTDVTALKASKLCSTILFSGAANGEIKIWELQDATCIRTLRNASGWVYKFIIFERPQHPETEKIVENQENVISRYASHAPSKTRTQQSPVHSNSQTALSYKKSVSALIGSSTPATASPLLLQPNSTFSMAINGSTKARLVSPSRQSTSTTYSVQQKRLRSKKFNEQLKKIQFLTACFDGTLKLWDATQEVPIDTQKSKHSFDCYPFGAVTAFQKDDEAKISIFTTGNKNDTTINVWNID